MKAIKLCLLLCCVASLSWGQVRITEVNTTSGDVTLTNMGGSVEDISGWWLCNFPAYDEMSTLPLVSGSTMLMAGTSVTVTWSDAVASDGECGLYNANNFTSSTAIEDYMQWASDGHTRENVAVSAGVWCVGEFVAGTSPYSFTGGASDFCSAFWADAVVPGCTNSIYDNYNPSATVDDGSCGWNISFSVDMNNYVPAFGYVNVSGAWNGWCGDCNQLTDADLDGVWEGTFSIPDGDYRFKYSVDNWTDSEPLGVGAGWTCTVQEGDFINRDMSVAGAGYAISTVCWDSCQACPGAGTPGCTDASAQNYDSTATESNGTCEYLVTFRVNMANYSGAFGATEVNGAFNGWCGNCNAMADADLDDVWEVEAPITEGWYEYKYSLDAWADQEGLTPGDACVVTNFGNTNRHVAVTGDVVLPVVCWASCSDCVASAGCTDSSANNYDSTASSDDGSCLYDVTFTVDMNNYGTAGVDYITPEVNGGFNGWCGGCNALVDPELDGVWTTTLPLPAGSYDYQFAIDAWTDQEFGLDPAAPCTNGGNRFVNVSGPTDQGLVCWESCSACVASAGCTDSTANNYDSSASSDDGSCTYDVTFTVDMNNYGTAGVDYTTPEVNGGFNSWCGSACNPMSDPELDGVWTTTISLPAGNHEYKFAVDNWTDQEFPDASEPCMLGANRLVVVSTATDIGEVCWGSCSACPVGGSGCTDSTANNYDSTAVTDDGSCAYDVTFHVDMNNYGTAGVDYTTPEVNGGFNGWCGSACNPMSDPEMDGVWTTTISLSSGNQEYKFAVDNWTDQEYPAGSCMLGANRLVVVTGVMDLGVVCWGSCSACVVNSGCTDSTANNYDSTAVTDDGSCAYDVTFHVDMNNYGTAGVDYTTPEVNGGFNGWCGSACNPMSDPEMDGVWTTTISLLPGNQEYKFAVDNWTDQEYPAGSCMLGANRLVVVTGVMDLGVVCWGSCSACVANSGCTDSTANNYDSTAVTDDGSCTYDVTFSVDMNSFGGGFTGVSVFATFNGWDVNANPLTDADLDGVWEVTLPLLNGAHEFKYAVDGPPGQEAFTGAEPCIVGADPYWNRSLNVSGNETLATVCYNSCDACPVGGSGCTDTAASNYDSTATIDDGSCVYSFDVTLSVNTANITVGPNGMYAGGGVLGDAIAVPLSDPDLDGTWTGVVALNSGTTGNYIFLNSPANGGDWGTKEDLSGLPCADPLNWNDRILPAITADVTLLHCFGSCESDGSCPTVAVTGCTDSTANNYDSTAVTDDGSCAYDVTFHVDMNNYGTAGVDYTTPEVNGGFNGWCGSACNPMSDPEMDGVWTTTISLSSGNQEYKFAVDNWTDQEYPAGSCMLGANRLVVVTGVMDLGVVCWGSCSACVANSGCTDSAANNYDSTAVTDDGSCAYDVIFSVDMNTYGAAFTTPEVNGTFNGWCGSACNPMSDPEMDGVWTTTISLLPGTYEYKFAVDNWTDQEFPDPSEPCMLGANRQINVSTATDIGVVCWGSCSACPTSGCTDPAYTEFDPYAGIDDGSCATLVVEGCAYAAAINYDSMANTDDGSCLFDCTDPCPGDFDDNLVINTADLLSFLTFFGTTCTP